MPSKPPRLSKSRLLAGLQCPLSLWHQVNPPQLAAEVSPALAPSTPFSLLHSLTVGGISAGNTGNRGHGRSESILGIETEALVLMLAGWAWGDPHDPCG
jgi:hypothetical protein